MRWSSSSMLLLVVALASTCGGQVVVDSEEEADSGASSTGDATREACGELLCAVGERCCMPCHAPAQYVCVDSDASCPPAGPTCV